MSGEERPEPSAHSENERQGVLLSLEGISKRYQSPDGHQLQILSGASLSLSSGESVALTGPSGSGKSTLIQLSAGLDAPDEGVIRWRGAPLPRDDEAALAHWRRQEIGFIFQDFRLFSHLSALDNVALPLELLGRPLAEARARAENSLATLGLAERLGHRPGELSGGEQQRVAIARAFIHRPALVLADEPTGNLDPVTAAQVLEALLELQRSRGGALLVVTHDESLAARLDRRLRLRDARLWGDGEAVIRGEEQ